ncbi:MAG: hypothetical protein OES34_11325 [Nitrosopumilus sp.]|nr:hypothetical protein [Nitrosopumilus sp.]
MEKQTQCVNCGMVGSKRGFLVHMATEHSDIFNIKAELKKLEAKN